MEWLESMTNYGQAKPHVDEDMVDDEDFYSDGVNGAAAPTAMPTKDALPGAAQDGNLVSSSAVLLWDQLTLNSSEPQQFQLKPSAKPCSPYSRTRCCI